jgi:hypothetical protein
MSYNFFFYAACNHTIWWPLIVDYGYFVFRCMEYERGRQYLIARSRGGLLSPFPLYLQGKGLKRERSKFKEKWKNFRVEKEGDDWVLQHNL